MVRKIEKNNLSYWERRQVQNMYAYMQRAEETADQIAAVYYKSSLYLNQKMDAIFDRYKKKHGLSDGEARRLINNMKSDSIDELLSKLKSGDYSSKEEIIKELEAPAYRARIERLQELQYELDLVIQSVYQQEKAISTEHYIKLAQESYYRSIFDMQQRTGAGFYFSKIDAKQIDKVIHSKWSGENYSSRIWNNTQKLANTVKEELLINLITGRTNREASEAIRLKFAQSSSNARRLVRTESNYIATELNSKAYEECGIKKYRYLATLDLRTSETCRELDNKIFLLKDRKIGVNCPPMHPWCRSTTVSVINEKYIAAMQRSAIDPSTGKRILVPASMSYKEWYDKYVNNNPKAQLEEKKIKNRSSDRTQYKQYQKVLKEDVPKTLDDFQTMKYTNGEKWKETKHSYRIVNQYKIINGNVTPKKIIELHESNMQARKEFSGGYGKSGNLATASCNGKQYIAHSKVQNETSKGYEKYNGNREFCFLRKDRQFKTLSINGWDRKVDGEAKIFEHLNATIGNQKVEVYLNTGFPICESCKSVMEQFKLKNPNINLNVIQRKGEENAGDN